MQKVSKFASITVLFFLSQFAYSGSITDTFSTGDTLTANHLNNAKAAVNDNDSRITQNESDLAAMQSSIAQLQLDLSNAAADIAALQAAGTPTLVSQNFYADKLTFLTNTGQFRDCDPAACVLTTVDTAFEYYPLSGLDQVILNIPADGTQAIISTSGSAIISNFGTAGVLDVGLFIDGIQPADGARNFLLIRAGGTNRSSGQQRWDMSVPVTLSAGVHTISVKVKVTAENEEDISINNYSTIDARINATYIEMQ